MLLASTANADVVIHKVQAEPANAPTKLVVWGTDFFITGEPLIRMGTYDDPLEVSADQSHCAVSGQSPQDAGFDCITVDLPSGMGDVGNGSGSQGNGEYLLWFEAEAPFASCEDGKPISLTFAYYPKMCRVPMTNPQDGAGSMYG